MSDFGDDLKQLKVLAWFAVVVASLALGIAIVAYCLAFAAQGPVPALMLRNAGAFLSPKLPYFFAIDLVLLGIWRYRVRGRRGR